MKKFSAFILIAAIALVGSVFAPKSAEAVPAFARQVGVPCNGCHFQYFPKLNSFGREFKLGGFTQTAQELIEDDGISLPPVLNMAFFAEIEYHKQELETASSPEKKGAERGEWQIPAEAALFVGGRVGENMGALVEIAGGVEAFKFIYSSDFGGVQGGLAAFSTEAMGPAYGMEGWNTGAQMHIQPGINMMAQSALSSSGLGSGDATGFTFFVSTDMGFLAVGLWGPVSTIGNGVDTGLNLSNYFRIAVTPQVGDWDAMVGIVATAGSTKCVECQAAGTTETELKTSATAIDAQVQGDVGGMSLGAYLNFVLDTGTDDLNIYNKSGMRKSYNAFSLNVDLGVTQAFTVRAAYWNENYKNAGGTKLKNNATTLGINYLLAQNVQLAVDYTTYGGDKVGMVADNKSSDMIVAFKIGF